MKRYESDANSGDFTARPTEGNLTEGGTDMPPARHENLDTPKVLSRIPVVPSTEPEHDMDLPLAPRRGRLLNARVASGLLLGGALVLFCAALFLYNKSGSSDSASTDKAADKATTGKFASPAPGGSLAPKFTGATAETPNRQLAPSAADFPFPTDPASPVPALNGTANAVSREQPKAAGWGAPPQWPITGDPARPGAWNNAPDGQAALGPNAPTGSGAPQATGWNRPAAVAWDNPSARSTTNASQPLPWTEPVQPPPAVAVPQMPPAMIANRPSGPGAPASYDAASEATRPTRNYYESYLQPQIGANRPMTLGDRASEPAQRRTDSFQDSRVPYRADPGANYRPDNQPSYAISPGGPSQDVYRVGARNTYPAGSYPNTPPGSMDRGTYPRTGDPGAYPAAGYPNTSPLPGYQASPPASGYQGTYPSTGSQNTYPSTGYSSGYSTGNYQTAYPTAGWPPADPRAAGASGPAYGAYGTGGSAQFSEPGVARFEGVIDRPTTGAPYDRAGSSIH